MMNVVRPDIASSSASLIWRSVERVDRGGGVVEDQDPRVGEQGPGDRDSLALAAREGQAALADARVIAVGQVRDELVGLRAPCGLLDRLARDWTPAGRA